MKIRLTDSLFLSAAIGFFIVWLLEIQRAGFAQSYMFLLACLSFLLAFQFQRVKRRQRENTVSPTVKQMIEKRKKK
jgi:Flp pilus assembly protein TadB